MGEDDVLLDEPGGDKVVVLDPLDDRVRGVAAGSIVAVERLMLTNHPITEGG